MDLKRCPVQYLKTIFNTLKEEFILRYMKSHQSYFTF